MFKTIKDVLFGRSLDPMRKGAQNKLALTAFIAWVGLGADGLSSSCYGPEQAYLALQGHTSLALYLALLTAVTVFLIAFGYNQVIQLFPHGGGGYKVATSLLGKYPGLVAGCALIMDYTLTIVISIVSAVEALLSFLPHSLQTHKLGIEAALIAVLIFLNMRGMKESIKILLPIFLGFLLTHIVLIFFGIGAHINNLHQVLSDSVSHTQHLAASMGIFFVVALFMHAYAMGGGTYTGLEAVSNNVNILSQPRVKTGKITMLYMAISLSITAGGIMLLYLLWDVVPSSHATLNAVVFGQILHGWPASHLILVVTLVFEAGLLFVSANTGFLGGPAVLANMAIDNWLPHRFRLLSNRLVKQNGIFLYGILAIILLFITRGHLVYLIVFYSFNVFLAFTLSLISLVKHWWAERRKAPKWLLNLSVSFIASFVCAVILLMITINRFFHGSLIAIFFLGLMIVLCLFIRKHYNLVAKKLRYSKRLMNLNIDESEIQEIPFDANKPTAIYFVNDNRGVGVHTILWSLRMFPKRFHNMIFVTIGEIDVEVYGAANKLNKIQKRVEQDMEYYQDFAKSHGFATKSIIEYGVNPVEKCTEIAEQLSHQITGECIYFASSLVWGKEESWIAQLLHNETAFAMQRKIHMQDQQMVIIPMNIDW